MVFNYMCIRDCLTVLEHPYPSSDRLRYALFVLLSAKDEESLKEFIKLWLTEGVPYIFKDIPILYERVRTLLSKEFNVDFKKVFMIGSGKLGLSLDPKKFTLPFRYPESDLDFTLIDEKLFRNLGEDFWRWRKDYLEGRVYPKNEERKYWEDNSRRVPNNIKKGFIDVYKIPARKEYRTRYKFTHVVPQLRDLIFKYTSASFCDRKITFRVHRDWESFFRQNRLNIGRLRKVLNKDLNKN